MIKFKVFSPRAWTSASLGVESWTLFPQDTLGIKAAGGNTAPTISAKLLNTELCHIVETDAVT